MARDLLGKPGYSFSLSFKLLLDSFSDMHSMRLSFLLAGSRIQLFVIDGLGMIQKRRRNLPAYPTTQALALPTKEDKQLQLAHACMIYIDTTEQADRKVHPFNKVGI